MAQHDYVIDNGPGLAVRTDINAMAAAIQSSNSGTVEPASKVPGQLWFNTTTGVLSMRNTGNTAWAPVGGLSTDGLTLFLKEGTTTRGTVAAAGGTDTGTVALRAFNNAGTQTALFYLSVADIGTDRNTLSFFNANDQAIWFRTSPGVIRGGVYNYTSGRTELRSYSGGALKNYVGVDESISGFTSTLVWTYNSNAAAGDVWISHRVSGTRAMRWYFAQSGDIYLQESDDNYASHFINVFGYSRGTNNVSFPNYVTSPGHLLTGAGGSNNGLFNGTGDGANYTSYNIMLRSWYGIGFPSATDGVNRIFMNTRNGDIYTQGRVQGGDIVSAGTIYAGNGSAYMQGDGNVIFSGGMTVYGGSLYDALGAVWNKPGLYTGSDTNELNFPIGHHLILQTSSGGNRNAVQPVYLFSTGQYQLNVSGTALSGTWRTRGAFSGSGFLMQRVA